ncbi:MAG: UDP-glucose 4-epimerase GalE [Fimbriiglobus sp.]
MRILVTGGAGFIGSHTVRHLLAHGHDVIVVDNLSLGHRESVPAARLVVADLKDIDRLDQLMILERIEAVIHFAADAAVGESVTNPSKYYHNNLLNSLQLLERVRRNGIPKFVFSSTCATYGVPSVVPITEETPQAPINPYGHTKLAFEKMLSDYAAAYPLGFVALRYFNASGASPDASIGEDHTPETHLIPLVLQVALGQRKSLQIYGTDYPTPDGTCIRDYIHVDDLASAHRLAIEQVKPHEARFYNVGIGTGYSVKEVIRTAEEVTGKSIAAQVSPRRPGDPPALVASSDKIRRELGWHPQYTSLKAIIETAWNWHKTHPQGYRTAKA